MATAYGVDIIQISERGRWDPIRGLRVTSIYQGTQAAIIAASALVDSRSAWDIVGPVEGAAYQLIVDAPDDSDVRSIFEVVGQELSKSVYEHPRTVAGVSTDDQNTIKNWFKGAQNPATFTTMVAGLSSTDAQVLAYLLFKDQLRYQDAGYVLRQRTVAIQEVGFTSLIITPSGSGLVFLTSDLVSGGGFDLGMDDTTESFIGEITAPTEPTNYTWGWLMQPPAQIELPGGKMEYRTEWRLNLWSNYLYDLAAP